MWHNKHFKYDEIKLCKNFLDGSQTVQCTPNCTDYRLRELYFLRKEGFQWTFLLQARLWSSHSWSSQSVRSPTSTKTIFEKFTSSVRISPFKGR